MDRLPPAYARPKHGTARLPYSKTSLKSRSRCWGSRDAYSPFQGADIKDCFEGVKRDFDTSHILIHWQGDAHQDHRLVAELTHNTFRDHLVLE